MKNKTMTIAREKGGVDEKLSELAADEHGGIFIGKHHKDIKGIIGKLFGLRQGSGGNRSRNDNNTD